MGLTDEEFRILQRNQEIARALDNPQPVIAPAAGKPQMSRQNKWEHEYAQELDALRVAGIIRHWAFESVKLRLADGCWYCPDFRVITADGVHEFHEVKGFWREDALIKFKVAAEIHPYRFMAIRKRKVRDGGGWEIIKTIDNSGRIIAG